MDAAASLRQSLSTLERIRMELEMDRPKSAAELAASPALSRDQLERLHAMTAQVPSMEDRIRAVLEEECARCLDDSHDREALVIALAAVVRY